jgi:hypothetical protein
VDAKRGLHQAAVYRAAIQRLLADTRSSALATRFARQWLRLQDLESVAPDRTLFPDFDSALAASMLRETELFFDSIVRADRSVLDLLTADYRFSSFVMGVATSAPFTMTSEAPPRTHEAVGSASQGQCWFCPPPHPTTHNTRGGGPGLHPTTHNTRGGGPGLHPTTHNTRGGGPGPAGESLEGTGRKIDLPAGGSNPSRLDFARD